MQNRFQYMIFGAILTLLIIFGLLIFLLSPAQADNTFARAVNEGKPVETAVQITNQSVEIAAVTGDQTKHGQASNLTNVKSAPEVSIETQITTQQTNGDPITDTELILAQVWEFARQQERDLLGREGWIYIEKESYAPVQFKGGGSPDLPLNQLYPDDISTFEYWNHVDEAGFVYEWLSTNKSPDGVVRQSTVMSNGRSVNLTLRNAGLPEDYYTIETEQLQKVDLPTTFIYDLLEEVRYWSDVQMQAYQEKDSFIVSWEQMYAEPLETQLPEPVIGTRSVYIFDMNTGQLQTSEFHFLPLNGKWQIQEQDTYLTIKWLPQLPHEADQLFQDAVNSLEQ